MKGFVRVNGATVTVRHTYAVTAPDSFDPAVEVTLVLTTPSPIAPADLAKAATRKDVFALVRGSGAIVEVRKNGHNVYIQHAALKGEQLQTGGGFPEFKITADRIAGDVHTFMPGDEDSFGFKVRFEIAFDAPIVKRIPVAKATTTAPAAASKTPKAPSGPLPKTRGDAEKWLQREGLPTAPTATDALGTYLTLSNTLSADAVRAYLVFGADVTKPSRMTDTHPLNSLIIMCHGKNEAPAIAELLLQAGADPNQKELDGRKAAPAMGAVTCPDVLKAVLARKPDLNAVDANGLTAMHYALRFGQPRDVTSRMIKDAGFDMARWRKSLVDEFGASTIDGLASPAAPPAARTAPSTTPATSAPRPAAIDWKELGPYPARSKADAARLLARPGTSTTVDEHFWDGIAHREPQRLAVALQAGANVRQLRQPMSYTPLVYLAERCDVDREPDAQVSIAEQLIAAGADLTGVDANKANALIVGADDCPIGVIRAFIKAGMPLQAVSATKSTALQAAIYDNRADVVEALLDAGLDPKKEPYNVGRLASGNKAIEAALKKKRK